MEYMYEICFIFLQFCEKLGLKHESCGEAEERHIIIRRKETLTEKPKSNIQLSKDDQCKQISSNCDEIKSTPTLDSDSLKSDTELSKDQCQQMCSNCNKTVYKQNFLLHQLHCHKIDDNGTKKKAPKKIKSLKKQLKKADEEDIDNLVSAIVKADSTCSLEKCNKNVKLIGQKCSHCGRTFCLTHCTPEFHGCGLAAKIQARNKMRADMNTSLNPNSLSGKILMPRPALEKKLGEKLKKMSHSRNAKQN